MITTRVFTNNAFSRKKVLLQRYNNVEEVPESHREPGIMSGYRHVECSVYQAVLSLFNATNETVNFWTHFIPTLYFIWQFLTLAYTMPLFSDPYLYPFVCYMVASCCYPLMSCIAHAFSCLSVTATHVCFFLDYAALALYSWGVSILYYSYCLPNYFLNSYVSTIFLPIASIITMFVTFMACSSRFCSSPVLRKSLRVFAFIIPYIWGSIPLIWRLLTCDGENDTCTESIWFHARQFVSVFMATFFYASHLPERLAPGKFDIVGHSHNFLHLFGIIATNEQLHGALIDLNGRRKLFESISWETNAIWTTTVTPILVFINILIIIKFSFSVHDPIKSEKDVKKKE